jgi:iron complex outermembrane receptor protein
VTWQIDDTKMVYATWSQGYRPGGINRRGTLPPYVSDFLTNYELGWKTTVGGATLVFNGALFREDWEDFQFSYLGQNGLTEIRNANQAQDRRPGAGPQLGGQLQPADQRRLRLVRRQADRNYCGWLRPMANRKPCARPARWTPTANVVDGPQAASGTQLPITPRFKGALNARYTFDLAEGEAYWQASAVACGQAPGGPARSRNRVAGHPRRLHLADVSAGWRKDSWSIDLFLKNAFDERARDEPFRPVRRADLRQPAVHGDRAAAHVRFAIL